MEGPPEESRARVRAMTGAIVHRGPDEEGFWDSDGVYFGYRRLSVIDITGGSQPMTGESRSVIVFNGEIYNYLELREELEAKGAVFRTNSDTEVLLAAYERWGERCLDRLVGMFAFAIWDPSRRKLFLARDRVGKKPLYYFQDKGFFAFASELKALLSLPEVKQKHAIDPHAVSDFLSLGYILTPKSIFKNIYKLPAAHAAWLDPADMRLDIREYWDIKPAFTAEREPYDNRARQAFTDLFHEAVKVRLHADVPLGAFLSGGVDSAAVVAAMARTSSTPVHAFCIGFQEESYDESEYAKLVAEQLKIELAVHEQPPLPEAGLAALVWHTDEPFADTSIMPTYLLNKKARENVTVALSGDGGDELLAGYPTYRANALHRYFMKLPGGLRALAGGLAQSFLRPSYKKVSWDYKIRHFLGSRNLSAERAHYWWRVIFSEEEKRRIMSEDLLAGCRGYDPFDNFEQRFGEVAQTDFLSQTLYVDMKTWLQDDILVKADRMSMASSLEVRSPFLDHRLIEFCARLDGPAKIKASRQKMILKDAMKGTLPPRILSRTKRGFNAPTRHFGAEKLAQASEHRGLFKPGFALDPKFEDITYKSFAFATLGHWLNMYGHYEKTGQWRTISDGLD